MSNLAWGKKVSPAFRRRVIQIAYSLNIDPNYLMAAMAFETGETFSPSVKNPGSSATGLIQFMRSTAESLGTTTAELAAMTAEEQLEYVYEYFKPYGYKLRSLSDVYMAILWPRGVGMPDSHVLWANSPRLSKHPNTYAVNKGLDANKDGVITKAEAAAKVQAKLLKGMHSKYLWIEGEE